MESASKWIEKLKANLSLEIIFKNEYPLFLEEAFVTNEEECGEGDYFVLGAKPFPQRKAINNCLNELNKRRLKPYGEKPEDSGSDTTSNAQRS